MVLVTGANGFLGRNLTKSLKTPFETLGRSNATYEVDLSKHSPHLDTPPDVVLHLAGKAHSTPKTAEEAQAFFDVNLQGTKNLVSSLEALERLPKAVIFASTVAVYGLEEGVNISEDHPLNGATPYAKSKLEAEAFLEAWGKANSVTIGILRLPLIVGPNPPGNLGAMVKGIRKGRYFRIGAGDTRKSVVLAEDIVGILPKLMETGGIYNLTDGHHPSFAELETTICEQLGKGPPLTLPLAAAQLLGKVGNVVPGFPVNSSTIQKMTSDLTFDDSRARALLDWQPRRAIDHFFLTC